MVQNREIWINRARELDLKDPLAEFREMFHEGEESLIYFDGNSLGKLPAESARVASGLLVKEWGEKLIRGWNDKWWEMPVRAGQKLAKLIGAKPDEVIISDSTSVNLYKLLSGTLRKQKGRKKVISDDINFPSDLYIMQGVIDDRNEDHKLLLAHSSDGITVPYSEFESLIDDNTAVVVLTHVSFRSSFMYDMKRITSLAHSKGALVIWDLCHSIGAVPVSLNNCIADMAVGCTYKYLNGGPGSPAFIFVRNDLQNEILSPVWGWLGEENPFEFSLQYRPADDMRQYMTGTPGILSLSTLEPSFEMFEKAGMDRIREKSQQLTGFMIELFTDFLSTMGFRLGSPLNPEIRGSHVSFKHAEAFRICKALQDPDQGEFTIIPDFRPPDNIRLGLAPLYNTFTEIVNVMFEIERIVREDIYMNYDVKMDKVT